MTVLAIIGSRVFTNLPYAAAIAKPFIDIHNIEEIVSGGAKGADHIAEQIAKSYKLRMTILKANWDKYGRGAGMIRNNDIIDTCDIALVFWDGKSSGTRDSINKLAKAKKPFMLIRYDTGQWEWFN